MKKEWIGIALIVLLFDQLIKYIICKCFYYGMVKTIIPHFLFVTLVYNDGAAWSTFSGQKWVLIGVALIAMVVLWWYQKSFKDNKRNMVAFGLVYGGLLGNLIDRVRLGYVIDFLKINLGNYNFPVFNLADMAIVSGFALIIYAIFKGEDKCGNKSRK